MTYNRAPTIKAVCYPIGVPGEYEVNKFYSYSGNLNILISNRIIICYYVILM